MALRLCRLFTVGNKISTPVLRGTLVRASSHGGAGLSEDPHKDKLGQLNSMFVCCHICPWDLIVHYQLRLLTQNEYYFKSYIAAAYQYIDWLCSQML